MSRETISELQAQRQALMESLVVLVLREDWERASECAAQIADVERLVWGQYQDLQRTSLRSD